MVQEDAYDEGISDSEVMDLVIPKPAYQLNLDLLKQFYNRVFPCHLFHVMLKNGFNHREFSYTLPGDIYVRFKSYETINDFKTDLIKNCPVKIDIGGIYDTKPKDKRLTKSFNVLSKEFVLDIDLTDYDDVRTCCENAAMCSKCWLFIIAAIRIIDSSLRSNFGFSSIMWVYSGRRGVHCWVADKEAMDLSMEARKALVMWFSPPKQTKHPFIDTSLAWCQKLFMKLLTEMDIFKDNEKLLKLVPAGMRDKLGRELDKVCTSNDKWKKASTLCSQDVLNSIVVKYTWPRLDQNVSIGVNHLLKSPFSVHPKTGKVCVPFDIDSGFNPMECPTLEQVTEDKSVLEPFLKIFKQFCFSKDVPNDSMEF